MTYQELRVAFESFADKATDKIEEIERAIPWFLPALFLLLGMLCSQIYHW